MTTTIIESHRRAAEEYFLSLAEVEQSLYLALNFESPAWQFHRDRFVNLSDAAARLMGENIPFID